MTTEQLFQTIENYLEGESDYSILEVFKMFNDTTLTLSSDEEKQLLEFISDEADSWNRYSDEVGEYDNRLYLTSKDIENQTVITIHNTYDNVLEHISTIKINSK